MKQKLAALLLAALPLCAFEPGQLSLDSVSNFEAGDAAFGIRHRFFGDITKSEDFFGMDDGANILLSLRYALFKSVVFEVHHTREDREYNARVGFVHKFSWLHTQLNVNYFSFEEPLLAERKENVFVNAALQTPLMFEHLRLTGNVGYDNYYEKAGGGIGIELLSANPFPETLTFTESISLLAEYYTKYEGLENFDRKYNAFAAGFNFRTYGHHFEILTTNANSMDPRTMMQGTDSNVMHFGFNINRKF